MKKSITLCSILSLCIVYAYTAMILCSCSKSSAANKNFIGTFTGTDSTYTVGNPTLSTNADTLTVTAGSSNNAIAIAVKSAGITLNATVSGVYVNVPSQTETVNGLTGSISGAGSLQGSVLNLLLTDSTSSGVLEYDFYGAK